MDYYKDQIKKNIAFLKSQSKDDCSEVIMSTDTYKALKEDAFFYYYNIDGAPIIINDDMDFLRINLTSKNGYIYVFKLEEKEPNSTPSSLKSDTEYYILVQWINGSPFIDGSLFFDSKEDLINYQSKLPYVKGVTHTICRINFYKEL